MAKNTANVEAQSMVLQLGNILAWLVVVDDDSALHRSHNRTHVRVPPLARNRRLRVPSGANFHFSRTQMFSLQSIADELQSKPLTALRASAFC